MKLFATPRHAGAAAFCTACVAVFALISCRTVTPPPIVPALEPKQREDRVLPDCLTVRRVRSGNLAFVIDREEEGIMTMVIDIASGNVLPVGPYPLSAAGWSPSGKRLLLDACFDLDEGSGQTLAFWAPAQALAGAIDWLALPTIDGALHALPFPKGGRRRILPPGSLGLGGQGDVLWSADGRIAWTLSLSQIEEDEEAGPQVLFVSTPQRNQLVAAIPLSEDVASTYYQLVDWVPQTNLILAGRGALDVQSWMAGVPLVVIDTYSGKILELGVSMLLSQEAYAWHPSEPGVVAMAVGESGYLLDTGRLILLNVITGESQPLTPEDLAAYEPAWAPDGSRLAYAALPMITHFDEDIDAESALVGRAIYVIDFATNSHKRITQPADAIDGWPQWLPDGAGLLYTRQHNAQTEVRSIAPHSGQERIVVAGLPDPTCYYAGCSWWQLLAYTPGPSNPLRPGPISPPLQVATDLSRRPAVWEQNSTVRMETATRELFRSFFLR